MSAADITAIITTYFDAYERNDAVGCATVFSNDAWLVSPWGPPITGREAIQGAHLTWFEEGETNKAFNIIDLQVREDTAVCLFGYDAMVPTATGLSAVAGVSLNAFALSDNGQWFWTHCSINELDDAV